ncbi:hypothetical protein SteCoe_20916 [Stentor coeruleus]|uniref:Cyclic nucleotide-binding domain-containing protein n=1 Tax=Stentor coeruleus TaxID=5963 RepID=A0A1R2BRA4_9CILI|nr:hypothetical protein SteCoe_20916 [Stentor coeruleus]
MQHIASSTVTWKSETESSLTKKKCVFLVLPDGKLKGYWNVLMIIAMLYSIIAAPYQMAFMETEIYSIYVLDLLIDVLFFLDIIFSCFTGYYDEKNNLVTSKKLILLNYAKSWLIFDFLACFPMQLVFENQSRYNSLLRVTRMQRLYRVLRIAKVLRLIKLFKNKEQRKHINLVLKISIALERLIYFLLLLVFLIHILACFWVFIGKMYNDTPVNWISRYGFQDYNSIDLYIVSLYWSITTLVTVGYGDISATNIPERCYCFVVMIIGIILYSYTISSISNIISAMDTRKAILNKKLDLLAHIARKYKISTAFHTKLSLALEYEHKNNDKELEEILNDLPLSIKHRLLHIIFEQKISKNFFFTQKSLGFIAWVASRLKPLKIDRRDFIFKENEFATDMYFIIKGCASMMIKRGNDFYPFIILYENYYFGEIDLLFSNNKTHLNTVYTEDGCELLTLSREHFEELLGYFEDEAIEICIKARDRLDRINQKLQQAIVEVETKFQITAIPSIPFNQAVNISEIKSNARRSVEMNSIVRSTSMYKNIVELKNPETALAGMKRKIKNLSVYTENIHGMSNKLFEAIIAKKNEED